MQSLPDKKMQLFIGHFLRIGALSACFTALAGGIIYLCKHGNERIPDFGNFQGEPAAFTTFSGILKGLSEGISTEIIQFGIMILIATPILRVLLSLVSFTLEKDKLYTFISFIVLAVILLSMFTGMKI